MVGENDGGDEVQGQRDGKEEDTGMEREGNSRETMTIYDDGMILVRQ